MAARNYRYRVIQEQKRETVMFGIQSDCGARVNHISTDYQEVLRLSQACNRFQLSPIHLAEVVDDFCKS